MIKFNLTELCITVIIRNINYIMMNINSEKCVGCGICVKDCFLEDIKIVNGKAKISREMKRLESY